MRSDLIDRARGLAILLMIWGHLLAIGGGDLGVWLRATVTRASLPIFCLCTGFLLAERNPRAVRVLQVFAAGLIASVLLVPFSPPLDCPDPLLVVSMSLCFWPLIRRWPVLCCAIGAVIGYTWRDFWYGYQPGHLVALYACGVMLRRSSADLRACHAFAARLPIFLVYFGRYPLRWYLAHAVVIAWAFRDSVLVHQFVMSR